MPAPVSTRPGKTVLIGNSVNNADDARTEERRLIREREGHSPTKPTNENAPVLRRSTRVGTTLQRKYHFVNQVL